MPAARKPVPLREVTFVNSDAAVGGLGLDFSVIPAEVESATTAAVEWSRLGAEFDAQDPPRFREGDRAALVAYCVAWALFTSAADSLLSEGLMVDGRSSQDRGRTVKSPAMSIWSAASSQLRYWARELGLTPDARVRQGITEASKPGQVDPTW